MRLLFPSVVLSLALTACASVSAQPAPEPAATPAAVYQPIQLQDGVWDADITFFDSATGAPNGGAKGVQINKLLNNGHWVTNDMDVYGAEGAPPKVVFQGHGVWGWDPVAKQYVDTWVDTNDGAVRTDYGFWKADTKTMHWTALQPDGNGHSVNYRMTERYEGDTKRTLTFYQVAMESGRLVKLAEMRFTRRPTSPAKQAAK